MREPDRLLEAALYVEDMGRDVEFRRRVFSFSVLAKSAVPDRLTALDVGQTQVLLLSKKGASVEAVATPGGKIAPNEGGGNRIWPSRLRRPSRKTPEVAGRKMAWSLQVQTSPAMSLVDRGFERCDWPDCERYSGRGTTLKGRGTDCLRAPAGAK